MCCFVGLSNASDLQAVPEETLGPMLDVFIEVLLLSTPKLMRQTPAKLPLSRLGAFQHCVRFQTW